MPHALLVLPLPPRNFVSILEQIPEWRANAFDPLALGQDEDYDNDNNEAAPKSKTPHKKSVSRDFPSSPHPPHPPHHNHHRSHSHSQPARSQFRSPGSQQRVLSSPLPDISRTQPSGHRRHNSYSHSPPAHEPPSSPQFQPARSQQRTRIRASPEQVPRARSHSVVSYADPEDTIHDEALPARKKRERLNVLQEDDGEEADEEEGEGDDPTLSKPVRLQLSPNALV